MEKHYERNNQSDAVRTVNIAVDGPAGAGKSTISRTIAARLGYLYVDTGALYRAVAYHMISKEIQPDDAEKVTAELENVNVALKYSDGEQRIIVNGEDFTSQIRAPEVSMGASAVSAIPEVRNFLFELQRKTARENDVIMDGRDIGTVVLPDADVKIFLTATAEERARRRHAELSAKGDGSSYEEVLADIKKRDHNDANRAAAPLKQASDAVLADTTGFEFEQSVEFVFGLIKSRIFA